MSTPVPALEKGAVVAGKLRIVRVLGAGGMGGVYEVEHEFTKHRRALKLLHPEMLSHPTVVARFLREASAAGHIGNPHIVETFDAGKLDSGEPYLVMELLEGKTLADRMAASPRLPVGEMVDILCQACNGVEAAHAAGIVHRDLKPENIFLIDRAGKTFVKILDFGISKFDPVLTGGSGVTKEGATIGTPFYMSPEQVNGDRDIDARTDVYALGVILYECASGKKPFDADALPKLSILIHAGKAASLADLRDDLPAGFVAVVHKAMARDKDERYPSARDLAAALASFGDAAMDSTMPDPTTGPSLTPVPERQSSRPSSQSSRPSAPGSVRPQAPARTMADAAISVAEKDAKKPRRFGLALAGVFAVCLAGGIATAFAVRSGPTTASPASSTIASPTSDFRPPPAASTAELVLPSIDAPDAGASVAVGASAPATTAQPPPSSAHLAVKPSATPATSVTAPTPSTRAGQTGLHPTSPY